MGTGEQHDWLMPMRRAFSAASLARYSSFVNTMKFGLPLVAGVLLLVLVVVPNTYNAPPAPKKETVIDATMRDPIYTSRDQQGRPFTLKGDKARQQPDTPGMTTITNPKGAIDLKDGAKLEGAASTATYDQKNGTMRLDGALELRHSDGTVFKTEHADVDMKGKNAKGDAPAKLEGPFGTVTGSGFQALDGGKTIIFTGPSKATLKMGNPPSQ